MSGPITILAVEPSNLSIPYVYLSEHYSLRRVTTVMSALNSFTKTPPHLALISSNFALADSLKLLETLKLHSVKKLIPIIFVVDFNHRIILLPGTTWAGHIGLLHNYSTPAEIEATVSRLLNAPTTVPTGESDQMLERLQSIQTLAPPQAISVSLPPPPLKPISHFTTRVHSEDA
jgi:DNA-binding NarL/FixJ family response regulator